MNWYGDGNQFVDNKPMGSGGFASPGGFMANTSFDSPSMSEDHERERTRNAMIPITAALLNNATYNLNEDVCEMDGVKLHQVTFVGIVSKINENATHMAYEIDDLTGPPISVKRWMNKDEHEEEYKRLQFREDTYVRVYGFIKVDDRKQKTICAFSINRVVDFNEITYHHLSVIHAKLSLQKAAANEISPQTGGRMQFGSNSFSGQGEFGQSIDGSGMSRIQYQVLEIISSANSTEGMGMNQIRQRLRGTPEPDIRDAVEFLSNEGHIYSTIDDDHFRSTNA